MSISLNDQMNKEWFIFKGTHHLGPYSVMEMEDFFKSGELTAQSLIWKEGTEKWEALSKIRDFKNLLESEAPSEVSVPGLPSFPDLPDLPDLPEEDAPPPMPPVAPKKQEASAPKIPAVLPDDAPPPVPLDAILDPEGSMRETKVKAAKYSKYTKHSPKIIFGGLVALFIVVIGWFIMNEQSSAVQIRVKGVMPIYAEKLQEIAAQNIPSITLGMALSLDGKTLYASTNKDGEILSIIKMKSISKRTLGTDDVELLVRGVIKDHLGVFARMQLTKGAQFVPGEYEVDFTGRRLHFLNRRFRFLNEIEFFKNLNTTFTYQTQALIFAGTPREFEKKLTEYSDVIVNEKLKPYTDKLERLQTFQSLLNKAMEQYLLVLEKMKAPKDISQYEAVYIKEISPMVQQLVVEAHE
ncbi:MAG: DUF4339 domain-containing protein, partial [Bdellovibrionales bacterium]|nr:DUF4339 domain-containing protein [Bdellovibrionales bacterium]